MLDFDETDPVPSRADVIDRLRRGEITAQEAARVNVRVPLQLLRAGVRLAALIPPQPLERVNAELGRSGAPLDLTQLKPEQLEELVEHLAEVTVEVDSPEARVRVFYE